MSACLHDPCLHDPCLHDRNVELSYVWIEGKFAADAPHIDMAVLPDEIAYSTGYSE